MWCPCPALRSRFPLQTAKAAAGTLEDLVVKPQGRQQLQAKSRPPNKPLQGVFYCENGFQLAGLRRLQQRRSAWGARQQAGCGCGRRVGRSCLRRMWRFCKHTRSMRGVSTLRLRLCRLLLHRDAACVHCLRNPTAEAPYIGSQQDPEHTTFGIQYRRTSRAQGEWCTPAHCSRIVPAAGVTEMRGGAAAPVALGIAAPHAAVRLP